MRTKIVTAYGTAALGIVALTFALLPFRDRINPTTVALSFLLVVLFVAASWGMRPAMVSAGIGMLFFNFFFLPPYGTLTIADPQNWVALAAFVVTAVTAGHLSARAKRRAEEAEAGWREIERLYAELRGAFDRASRAEALRQSEQMKSALLDAVTHDLRTPLTSIKVSVTTLLDDLRPPVSGQALSSLDTEGRREMLEIIDEEADRLNCFIGNLVELARIEAGQMRLRRGWTSVGEIIVQALGRAERHSRTHRIRTDVPDDVPAVRADGRALAEVVYTLVDNAAKYSPPGSLITVAARPAGDDGVVLTIDDEGRGVPEALRERVFEKFFRFVPDQSSGASQPTGTGVGLAIARGIVNAHGGRIWLEGGPEGRGTRIALTIPVGDEDDGHEPPSGQIARSGVEVAR
jgi:K+-sensing histidine kinase KdpD